MRRIARWSGQRLELVIHEVLRLSEVIVMLHVQDLIMVAQDNHQMCQRSAAKNEEREPLTAVHATGTSGSSIGLHLGLGGTISSVSL